MKSYEQILSPYNQYLERDAQSQDFIPNPGNYNQKGGVGDHSVAYNSIPDIDQELISPDKTITIDQLVNGEQVIFNPSNLGAGVISGIHLKDLVVTSFIESSVYVPGKSGFKLWGETGDAEFNDVIVRGNILGQKKNYSDDTAGYFLGQDTDGVYKMYLGDSTSSLKWDGTTLAVMGSITADSGTIGGWTISSDELSNGNVKLQSDAERILLGAATAPLTGVGIFIGKDEADYEFRAGDPDNAYIHWDGTGWTINGSIVTNLAAGSEVAIQEWTFSGTFSVTDADTVEWTSGTLEFMDGTQYSISGGNTGNMAAFTYVYLDISVSTTVLQTSTSFTAGAGKTLICTAQNGTSEASFLLMGGDGSYSIDGGNIAAASIIASKISVSSLSAISSDLGTITAGSITLDTSGFIRGGQTGYHTGTGFWLGYDTDAYKFSIGDGTDDNSLTWNGSQLNIAGNIIDATTFQIGGTTVDASAEDINTIEGGIKNKWINQRISTEGVDGLFDASTTQIDFAFSTDLTSLYLYVGNNSVPTMRLYRYLQDSTTGLYYYDGDFVTVASGGGAGSARGGVAFYNDQVYVLYGFTSQLAKRYDSDLTNETTITISGGANQEVCCFTNDGARFYTLDSSDLTGAYYDLSGTTLTRGGDISTVTGAHATDGTKLKGMQSTADKLLFSWNAVGAPGSGSGMVNVTFEEMVQGGGAATEIPLLSRFKQNSYQIVALGQGDTATEFVVFASNATLSGSLEYFDMYRISKSALGV